MEKVNILEGLTASQPNPPDVNPQVPKQSKFELQVKAIIEFQVTISAEMSQAIEGQESTFSVTHESKLKIRIMMNSLESCNSPMEQGQMTNVRIVTEVSKATYRKKKKISRIIATLENGIKENDDKCAT